MNEHKKIINSLEEDVESNEETGGCRAEIFVEENWFSAYKNSLKNVEDLSKFLF
jgi:hypothetical protein